MRRVAVNASASKFLSKLPSMECFTSVFNHSGTASLCSSSFSTALHKSRIFVKGAIGANLASKLGNHGLMCLTKLASEVVNF